MEIINFYLDNLAGEVILDFDNGSSLTVFFNENSGKIYMRPKIGDALGIYHKGIYLGHSEMGEHIMVHNHSEPGRAVITTWEGFAQNQPTYLDNKTCSNSPIERLRIALEKVMKREPYDLLNNSCQTFVNEACTNETKNDDTFKVIGSLVAVGLALFGLSALFED